jgi:hypothetical protein
MASTLTFHGLFLKWFILFNATCAAHLTITDVW